MSIATSQHYNKQMRSTLYSRSGGSHGPSGGNKCSHDTRNKLGSKLITAKNVPLKGFLKKMGTKLSCSCGPLKFSSYRFEPGKDPWASDSRRVAGDGLSGLTLCRLWAEVFHVTTSSSGTVKWTQVSEDLVPVNITCLQNPDSSSSLSVDKKDSLVFLITAYNSQVEQILNVRLVHPGTRIGQASECFVYWKDISSHDTWGLNFTSPIDAKQFRDCCDITKFRNRSTTSLSKASSRSTPASPSRTREPQCTCMTSEQIARYKAQNEPRVRTATPIGMSEPSKRRNASMSTPSSPTRSRKISQSQCTCMTTEQFNHSHVYQTQGSQTLPHTLSENRPEFKNVSESRSLRQRQIKNNKGRKDLIYSQSKSLDDSNISFNNSLRSKRHRSKSTDVLHSHRRSLSNNCTLNKKMTKDKQSRGESPTTSPETERRSQGFRSSRSGKKLTDNGFNSEPETAPIRKSNDYSESKKQSKMMTTTTTRNLYLDLIDKDGSSLSDTNGMFDSHCFATTPSSNSDFENNGEETSPTSQLLMDYEEHLRNTLEKGMDAESYSLHTFEALLTRSMENLEQDLHELGSGLNPQSTYLKRKNNSRGGNSNRMSERYHRPRSVNSSFDLPSSTVRTSRSGIETTGSHRHRGSETSNEAGRAGSRRIYHSSHNLRDMTHQDSIISGYNSDHEYQNESKAPHLLAQLSGESVLSNDSRLCYLTSSEISDEDRMSLTTAVSDDDVESNQTSSPLKNKTSGTASASFNCTGAVRKAGFLSVKKWLLRKKHQVELARKRGWKGYWVCLKGTTLLFYTVDSREGRSIEATPKHLIIVDGAIMQAIPEHPKRDYIFCLSTAFGDAYLFQAPCQVELENWITSIHSACAAAFARHRGKTGTLHLLQEEIYRLEKTIESDVKSQMMSELPLHSSVSARKRANENTIKNWDESLERYHCETFRLRCYMASLQSGELPNSKRLLTQVTRSTKLTLNQLGVFTVSSFHAYICARSPSLLNNLLAGRGATKRKVILSRSNSSRRSTRSESGASDKLVKVTLPNNQIVTFILLDAMTVEDFLTSGCSKKNLSSAEHFVRVKKRRELPHHHYFVPHSSDLIETYLHSHEVVEICAKIHYQVELHRRNLDVMWGFSVEAELIENSEKIDELCCYISRVEDLSVAMRNGIFKGDEILVINGAIVSDLDMMFIESVLQEEISLCMMIRSCRSEPPEMTSSLKTTDDMIERLVCPPPPSDNSINEDIISSLIVPAPEKKNYGEVSDSDSKSSNYQMIPATYTHHLSRIPKDKEGGTGGVIIGNVSPLNVDALIRTKILSNDVLSEKDSRKGSCCTSLSDAEKMRKVILELVETENAYVRHLSHLMNTYLEPLRNEAFLSNSEIRSLFGNIQDIYCFQKVFLHNLEEAIESEAQFHSLDTTSQFKNVLFSLGSTFLYYVNHFKLYSSFCASHSKAQKVLHPNDGNHLLQEFLLSLNPRQQHSSALESYLIKPIQRILKYPLLLQQLTQLTPCDSDERAHLEEALLSMEKVAEHINEMQRIHEEYGAIFDHLFRQHVKTNSKQRIDLSPGDLLYYGGVEWWNISDFLGKIKKGLELHAMCFVFKSAVVFLCKERLRQKKKTLIGPSSKSSAEVEIIRYQILIPVTEVQVRSKIVKDVESHHFWELIHLKNPVQRRNEKNYHLSNSTSDFRNAFLKTIRLIIRESVRNMSLPALETQPSPPPRSESSKQGSSIENNTSKTLQHLRKRGPGAQAYSSLQRGYGGSCSRSSENCTYSKDLTIVPLTRRDSKSERDEKEDSFKKSEETSLHENYSTSKEKYYSLYPSNEVDKRLNRVFDDLESSPLHSHPSSSSLRGFSNVLRSPHSSIESGDSGTCGGRRSSSVTNEDEESLTFPDLPPLPPYANEEEEDEPEVEDTEPLNDVTSAHCPPLGKTVLEF